MRGCFLDTGTMGAALDWAPLEQVLDAWQWHHNADRTRLAGYIADKHIVVTNKAVLDAETITAAGDLQLICVAATGTNNVDLAAAARRRIPVVNVADYATAAVSQHVFALMLAHATRWPDYAAAVARGDWSRSAFFCLLDYPIEELAGQTLGIIGHGELGQAVAGLGRAFGMRVLIAERAGAHHVRDGRVAITEVFEQADIISLHCPLTDATHHLIDAEALARMKPGAYLINTARGPIVDEAALAAALRGGRIAGAALDVLSAEPPPPDHPLLAPDIPHLTLTPHSAWASRGARQRVLDGVAANIRAFREGRIENRVN